MSRTKNPVTVRRGCTPVNVLPNNFGTCHHHRSQCRFMVSTQLVFSVLSMGMPLVTLLRGMFYRLNLWSKSHETEIPAHAGYMPSSHRKSRNERRYRNVIKSSFKFSRDRDSVATGLLPYHSSSPKPAYISDERSLLLATEH